MASVNSGLLVLIVIKDVYFFIATFVDSPTFYINYLAMHKEQMHAGAIRKLLFGLRVCN